MSDFVLLAWSFSIFSFRIILQKKKVNQLASLLVETRSYIKLKTENLNISMVNIFTTNNITANSCFVELEKRLQLTIIRDSERKGNNF